MLALGCALSTGTAGGGASPASTTDDARPTSDDASTGPRLLPDPPDQGISPIDVLPDGSRELVLGGLRVLDRPDGALTLATELLPSGPLHTLTLPDRLGGGLLLLAPVGSSTKVWWAKTWLGRPSPVVDLARGPQNAFVVGFDRVYASRPSGDWAAFDPRTGEPLPPDPLPRSASLSSMAFADEWRAVVVADVVGPLATFDAGATWHPVRFPTTPGGAELQVTSVGVEDGYLDLRTTEGRYFLDEHGTLSLQEASEPATASRTSGPTVRSAAFRSLGGRPLRAALADGWPVGSDGRPTATRERTARQPAEAVVAHGGSLYRISLFDGRVLERRDHAFEDAAGACHPVPLERGVGFVCGDENATSLWSLDPSFAMRARARFSPPRRVVSSGNGGLVVHGPCARDAREAPAFELEGAEGSATRLRPSRAAARACFFWPDGHEEEVGFAPPAGRAGSPQVGRPIALGDGRAALVVPPTGSRAGWLAIAARGAPSAAPRFIEVPARPPWLARATWLEGFEEREPGVLDGWVEHGGELSGVRLGLDGHLEIASRAVRIEETAFGSRFALTWDGRGAAAETTDRGFSWKPVEIPRGSMPRPTSPSSGCGPVGCALGPWLRVGWLEAGGPSSKPRLASAPLPLGASAHSSSRLPPSPPSSPLTCVPIAGRPAEVPSPPARRLPSTADRDHGGPAVLDAVTSPAARRQARLYVWSPTSGGAPTQAQLRFEDPFSLDPFHATRTALAPWPTVSLAREALGIGSGAIGLYVLLDSAETSGALYVRRSGRAAEWFVFAQGEPMTPVRTATSSPLGDPVGFVRSGAASFVLTSTSSPVAWLDLHRIEGGGAVRLARYPHSTPSGAPVRLVRRARSGELGLLVQGLQGGESGPAAFAILPVEDRTGELGPAVYPVSLDFAGKNVQRCKADGDGFVLEEAAPRRAPSLVVVGRSDAAFSGTEWKVQVDRDSLCVDALFARTDDAFALTPASGGASRRASEAIPLVAESHGGQRWEFRCGP